MKTADAHGIFSPEESYKCIVLGKEMWNVWVTGFRETTSF